MQIKLGEKIKELRQRDKRKQEDLAVVLGVTNQAVSRWEANGGYPDIEMLPAIANYFHITIDELFGYDGDRQARLQSYIEQADQICKHSFSTVLQMPWYPWDIKKANRIQSLPKEAIISNIIQSIMLKMNAGKKRYLYLKKY